MKQITESVYASVTIEPDSMYEVHSVVSGIIANILVKEGDTVDLDQPIVQIENSSSKLNLDNARLALQLAKDNLQGTGSPLKSMKDQIESARLRYEQDSVDYFRQKRLWEQNIGTARQYDQSKLAYEIAKQNLSALKKEYSRTETELKSAVKNARNNYENARIGKEDFTITSRLNGRVYEIFKEPGELISPQEPLATIGNSNSYKINMLVDEVDIVKVEAGQKVIVLLDAFDNQPFEAHITRILPQKNNRTQTFSVEADFLSPPKNLYSGLSGEANIIISRKEALVIPRRYLLEGNKVKTKEREVSVTTGIATMEFVEILSGIDSTTQIYLP
ncbi:efflux RND transporter periplasmic adaptor subunit [Fulvivirga lutea]|uniref:Efflux RND transporter periplasmic adaptor subunit n=1 Tax=Fulvivirga lutea TaxID=2810512 RepID=A0A974WLG0_9BACT|nr:efflux RND transporter periplasmic adaptor subunit [Fulvivirga lutea]